MEDIRLMYKNEEIVIPNSWEKLKPSAFLKLAGYVAQMEAGSISVGELRIRLLCDIMGWDIRKMKGEDTIENLITISEQLTFLFKIVYPDDDAALQELSNQDYRLAKRTDPYRLRHIPTLAHLKDFDYKYQLDLCFFAQLVPEVVIKLDRSHVLRYQGYRAAMCDGMISCSLSALQYIEARQLLDKPDSWPLMAAILYYPAPYDSEGAQKNAELFKTLPADTLKAIAMNFMALNTFIYTKTEFSLLSKFEPGKAKDITTDMSDALYDLCNDGLGNASEVEQLNLMTYLKVLRKKTIDGVRQLHGTGMDMAKIANETGLPPEIITKIV